MLNPERKSSISVRLRRAPTQYKPVSRIAVGDLEPFEAALRAQLLAMTFLQEGALEEASEALDGAPYPTMPSVDAWIEDRKSVV